MAAKKYITLERLQHFKEKLDVTYVKRELKTDSEDEYKVLSDNNLTDDLLQKIHNAGDSGFNGQYDSLKGKPKINGVEVGTSMTADALDLVERTVEDGEDGVATIKNDKTGGVMSYKPATGKSGLVAVDNGKNSNAGAKVMMRVVGSDYDGVAVYGNDNGFFYRKGTGLTADAQDELIVKRDISDMATKTQVGETYAEKTQVQSDIENAKTELTKKIDAAATSAYKPKGSCTFEELGSQHAPSKEELGNVYNVTDSFVTDDKFVEGSGHDYPANTNVTIVAGEGPDEYKYDALAGFVDLTPYVKTADFEDVTDAEIDEMFE